jgi:C-terminal processing protease CtpA/Prc
MRDRRDPAAFIERLGGTHRYILDDLVEEVLERQATATQAFLLRTSILERVTAPLCDAIVDGRDSAAILARLERDNLVLVPLDDERCWYRYHPLFAGLLRRRLERSAPDRVPALRARYRPRVALASDPTYYELVNEMLWQVGISHLALIPPGYWNQVEPTVLAEGSVGIGLRLLDGEAVITWVEPGSPAARAGLRPGLVIERVDGRTIDQIAEEALSGMEPPDNERHRREAVASALLGHIYGPPGRTVTLVCRDTAGQERQHRLERVPRRGETETGPSLPHSYVEFQSTRLEDGIGYIRFRWFHADLARDLPRAIARMRDAPGLIIDLRGNPGGMRDAAVAGATSLVSGRSVCATLHSKDGTREVALEPAYPGYRGPVVVLIDAMSKSPSEFFAACTQAIDRAIMVGERSLGSVGPASLLPLPNGAALIYPTVQERTIEGTVLGDHGVTPDIKVPLDRALLAQGVDSQLAAAVEYLGRQATETR